MIFTRSDGTYLVEDIDGLYHVVPKDIDPQNKYDFDVVRKYAEQNPSEVTEWIEPVISNVLPELDAIDAKSIRAIRSILVGEATEEDIAHLRELETKAKELRGKL